MNESRLYVFISSLLYTASRHHNAYNNFYIFRPSPKLSLISLLYYFFFEFLGFSTRGLPPDEPKIILYHHYRLQRSQIFKTRTHKAFIHFGSFDPPANEPVDWGCCSKSKIVFSLSCLASGNYS